MTSRSFVLIIFLLLIAARVEAVAQVPAGETAAAELDEANQLSKQVEKLNGAGKYAEAMPLAERALAIREKALGAEHLHVAKSLNEVGVLSRETGDYPRAEQLYLRALAICEQALGPEHPDVASTLNNLANLYRSKSDFVRAEPLYQRSLNIRQKTLGPNHLDVAASLNNLALLYRAIGDYVRAEQLHRRALEIWEKTLGPDHPDVALSLNNLALLHFKLANYSQAEPLYQRALAIREKSLGPEHPHVATSINNLANLYREQGDFERAEPLHLRALAIWEKALGPEHRIVASSLNDIANMYRDKAEYAKAERLYQRALAIREKALGPNHPAVALLLNDLAIFYQLTGNTQHAVQLRVRANDISEHNLTLVLTTGSEEQKRLYLDTLRDETNATVSLHLRAAPDDAQAARVALTNVLRRKGRALDAMSEQIVALRLRLAPEDRLLLDQFTVARTRFAKLVLSDPGKTAPADHEAAIANLATEVERLEAAVSRRSAEFRAKTRRVTLEAIQQALPTEVALIEIVLFRPFNAKARQRGERFGAPKYVAYVLRREGAPRAVELGDATVIDADVATFRDALSNPNSKKFRQIALEVNEKVMRPLFAAIGNATHLLVSADGELNLIPFEALVDNRDPGRYLIERFTFTYLTSGRDLLRMQAALENRTATVNSPVVVANPAFGEPAPQQIVSTVPRRALQSRRVRSVTSARSLAETYFAPLSGTAVEASTIKQLFPEATLLSEERATETAIKQVAAPRLMHIATHGFFLSQPVATTDKGLLRSGLALADANRHSTTGDDGILTALEASGLNLWGTKLVVLSACDTGLGEVRNGEGVYGLRRAFVLAGAESLIMSLWPVSDYPTKKLMTEYYRQLRQGRGRGAALRHAQLSMVKDNLHPFYWANFIQSGEWANLDGHR